MATQCVYYRDASGNEPVLEFLDKTFPVAPRSARASQVQIKRFAKRRAMVDLQIDRMNGLPDDYPPLAFPVTSQIEGELRELRITVGGQRYRILYQRSDNLFVLLHAIHKTTGSIPRADIDLAHKRFADFQERMDAERRRPPRAAGSDAP
jgi:phage-related protein